MAIKKTPASKPKPKPATQSPRRLENLAARPPVFDDTIDEQLVDHSGVFRVTSQIAQAQTGHGEDGNPRFANESLVMAAQRDGVREIAPLVDDEDVIETEAASAAKRQRLVTLAARVARTQPRKR